MLETGDHSVEAPASPAKPRKCGLLTRRRLLLGGLGAVTASCATGTYAVFVEPFRVQVTRLAMPVRNLPTDLVGCRHIQISDLHVGDSVPLSYLARWVEWVNAQKPDLTVVTGDIVNKGVGLNTPAAGVLLARIQARLGSFVILGNHDWGAYHMGGGRADLADRTSAILTEQEVRVLRNQSVAVGAGERRLHIVGLDDYWGDRFDPSQAFAGVGAEDACIALSHNPDSFLELLDRPASWVLSGHTHGGQVSIPWLGPPLLPVRNRRFASGHHVMGGRNLYVNRGLGWVRKIRFNCPPEITVFELQRA